MTPLPPKSPSAFAHKLASLQSRAWLPPALLLLALASVFILGDDQRGYFYRSGAHGEMSSKNMVIVENLSIEHNFALFRRQVLDADGEPTYWLYSRFPIGSYALIKLTTLPFGDSLSAKIYAARMLMLLFFVAAALMAYLALRRLASSRWIALTATLLAFSSPFFLYYGDVISSEAIVDIFAVLLVFHGMAVFEQEGCFRQLAVKTCAALFLGWHAYALLLPFIAFGLMRELVRARSAVSTPPVLCSLKRAALSLLRSRYLALGVVALAFGISMLTLNFTSEYLALNREAPLTELPSFKSMLIRTGVDTPFAEKYGYHLAWPGFLERQFHRVGAMLLPYAFSPTFVEHDHRSAMLRLFVILGIAVSVASLIGLLFVRCYTMLWASLAFSGFCWALPMRHTTASPFHHFEALFYIGVTLTLFSTILLWLHSLAGERLVAALSVVALLIFAFSALRMSQLNNFNQTAELAELREAAISDIEVIRNTTDGKAILINSMPEFLNSTEVIYYYFSGSPILYGSEVVSPEKSPDFIVTRARADGLASLTPQNRGLFLYEWNDYHRHITETIEKPGEALIRSDFDVYLNGNSLIYVKDTCSADDASAPFFLAAYPVNETDLPDGPRQRGFQNLDFGFQKNGIRQSGDDRCIAITPLPDYDIARIHTGQYIQGADGSDQRLWRGEIFPSNPLINAGMNQINETIAQAGAPLIRSDFDVYLNDDALIYVKDSCSENDTDAPFFLAAFPANENVLPDGSRQYGFQNLDFGFHQNGIRQSDGRCIAITPLPDYDIARISTGQYIRRADGSTQHLWKGELFPPNPLINDRLKDIDETIAQAGEPLIRSDFDVYLNDGALIYVKDGCSENDTDAPFFLAAFPANENDLPVEFRQRGFQNLDFGFRKNGVRQSDERCVALAQLPDYDIARISTGQYIRRADGSTEHPWEGEIRLTEAAP